MNKNTNQLVVVCRNIDFNYNQFKNPIYLAVETGVMALLNKKLPIKFACGDFDTLSKKEEKLIKNMAQQNKIHLIKFPSEKDYIDAELAIIEAIKQKINFQQIVLITEGDRWDMILAQLNFLNKYKKYQPILLTTNNYVFTLKNGDSHIFSQEQLQYHYISIFPLNCNQATYNFSGCEYYPDQNININNKDILAISNEFDKVTKVKKLSVIKGKCLITLYKNNVN